MQLVTVLVWQAADKCGGPWAERWFKDPADGHKLVSWESYIWKSLSAAQEGVAGDVQGHPSLPLLMGQKGPFVSGTDLPGLVCVH